LGCGGHASLTAEVGPGFDQSELIPRPEKRMWFVRLEKNEIEGVQDVNANRFPANRGGRDLQREKTISAREDKFHQITQCMTIERGHTKLGKRVAGTITEIRELPLRGHTVQRGVARFPKVETK